MPRYELIYIYILFLAGLAIRWLWGYNKTLFQFVFGFYSGLDYDWVEGFCAGLTNEFCFGLLSWARYEFGLGF